MGFLHKEKKRPHQFTLYVPMESQLTVKEAQKIAKREGESLSQKFIKFCQDYVRVHGKGNPQRLLFDSKAQGETKQCQHVGCDKIAKYQAFTKQGTSTYLCKTHLQTMLKQGVVMGYRGVGSANQP